MAFNVTEFRAAHRSWSFTIGAGRAARTFTARHVSAVHVMRYQDRLAEAQGDRRRQEYALRWLLRLAFPWRPSYLTRGDPARLLFALEPAARQAALADFFEALRGGPTTETPPGRATPGTTSSTPTPTGRR
jgi:hypothetical protein